MMKVSEEAKKVDLGGGTNVQSYLELLAQKNEKSKQGIADFVYNRFHERYIAPLHALRSKEKHGFSIMASCCLMVEALESFRQGLPNTKGDRGRAFKSFIKDVSYFAELAELGDPLYTNVRCGILHQAETTGGWKIRRDGRTLFDKATLTLDASKFLEALEKYLEDYKRDLIGADWDDEIWINLQHKMVSIVKNCERPNADV